ncbi:MAG: Cytochrome b5 [Thermotoga sp. 50_1627]|nr:MAG: Cytochrome b5 [Thermotoga sp. 50_64]KUK24350.1 MAG: Cytochrome b5 [Thermotoga sp. 50_1627]
MKDILVFLSLFLLVVTGFSLSLTQFNVKEFKGQYPLISLSRLLETDEFVSVEGVVYRISASKKFLTTDEVDPELLSESNLVGVLAMDIDELGTFTGKGKQALVAASGIVYDVTSSRHWPAGNHKNRHQAGEELTHELMINSPHGAGKIANVKPFGVLVFTPDQLSRFNGKNRAKSYIAFRGVVYDLSHLRSVPNYPFGTEATAELLKMPSYADTLSKSYAIGLLVFDEKALAKFDGQQNAKAFIKVGNIVYDVTDIPDWREKLHLESDAVAGKDYTSQFECELEETCSHDHPESDVLKQFNIVGFEVLR